VFPNRAGKPITRSEIEHRLSVAVTTAFKRCPSLATRRISPHTMRHTTAMHLLQSGVDIAVIALGLGHEDTATTHIYLEADLAIKEAAPKRLHDQRSSPSRTKPQTDSSPTLKRCDYAHHNHRESPTAHGGTTRLRIVPNWP
jgi:integrase/recombinase XerD